MLSASRMLHSCYHTESNEIHSRSTHQHKVGKSHCFRNLHRDELDQSIRRISSTKCSILTLCCIHRSIDWILIFLYYLEKHMIYKYYYLSNLSKPWWYWCIWNTLSHNQKTVKIRHRYICLNFDLKSNSSGSKKYT